MVFTPNSSTLRERRFPFGLAITQTCSETEGVARHTLSFMDNQWEFTQQNMTKESDAARMEAIREGLDNLQDLVNLMADSFPDDIDALLSYADDMDSELAVLIDNINDNEIGALDD